MKPLTAIASRHQHRLNIVRWVLILCTSLLVGTSPAKAEQDPWPCEVALCLANPQGPTAVSECHPPIRRAWRAWARGKKVPECHKRNADGSDGGELRASGTYIDHSPSNAYDPNMCPFSYYAGRERLRYCAFAGVTTQYVDGQMWGRIWYGGPGGVPYIEMLHVDPDHPRPPDGFEAAWLALKQDIEDKSEYAALAYQIWEASEARAVAEEKAAAAARAEADQAERHVTHLEAWLPGEIAYQTSAYQAASAAFNAKYAELQAAELALAKKPTDPAAAATVGARTAELTAIYASVLASSDALASATNQLALLPGMREQAKLLSQHAAQVETQAADSRSKAINDKAASDAAEEAAKPLPVYGSDGGT